MNLAELGRLAGLLSWYASCQASDGAPEEPQQVKMLVGEAPGPEAAATTGGGGATIPGVPARHWTAVSAEAFAQGRALVDEQVDSGVQLLLLADATGREAAAVAAIAALVDQEPVAAAGWGEPGAEAEWAELVVQVRDERHRLMSLLNGSAANDPEQLLEVVAPEVAATAGICFQAALRRTPALLDGEVSAAGALLAQRLAPEASAWWHAAHRTGLPAQARALERLELDPTLDLDLSSGGMGPVLALGVLRTAISALKS